MDKRPDISEALSGLLKTPLGQEIIRCLEEDLHKSLITDAEKAESQEKAYALLNRAAGVILAVGHLRSKAVIAKNKGNK